jgi:hypothetical protein
MSRDDAGKSSGMIRRDIFIDKLRPILGDNLNDINLLANHYTANTVSMIDYKQMTADMDALDDSETASSNSIIRDKIKEYKIRMGITLKAVFDKYSVKMMMDTLMLGNLMKVCGFANMDAQFIKGFIYTFNKKIGECLTYFQFVSAFDIMTQRQELAMMLQPQKDVWIRVKTITQNKYGKDLNENFSGCRSLPTLVQEIEKLPGLNERPLVINQLASLFSQNDERIDHFGLKLTEDLVGINVDKYLPMQKPDTTDTALKVPGSEITFKKLKGVKKFLQFLDSEAREVKKSSCLDIFKKYDTKNTNKIDHAVFV